MIAVEEKDLEKLILLYNLTKELAQVQEKSGIRGSANIRIILIENMINYKKNLIEDLKQLYPTPKKQNKWFWW